MSRPVGEVPPGLEFSDADAGRYFTDPLFHAQVYCVAQVLSASYGIERNEALAFGMHVIKCLESLVHPHEGISG
jgi:hypothetical protein